MVNGKNGKGILGQEGIIMRRKSLLSVIFLFLLCFMLASPFAAAEETSGDSEVPEGWIVITYLGDETKEVTIPAGTAIANLWEPETVYGEKFLYWTYNDDWYSLDGNRRQITKETIFYESEILRPVTVNTDDDIREMYEFEATWESGWSETEEPTTERDYFEVSFHTCLEDDDTWTMVVDNKELTLAYVMDGLEDMFDHYGYDLVGWFTKREGGKKITKDTPVTGDMDVYAHWKESTIRWVTYMKNFGKGDQYVTGLGYAGKIMEDPVVGRRGYKKTGWYTKPKGGKKMEIGSKLTSDITLYAHWEKVKVKKVSIKQIYGEDKAITVRYKKQAGVKGYQVQISTSKKFAKKNTITKTYNNKKVFKRTIKKLKKGQT